MRVALDAQLTVGTATGIGEYVRGLAPALRRAGLDVVELCEPRLDPWRFDRRVIWDQLVLPRRARAAHADLLHCAAGTIPLRPGLPSSSRPFTTWPGSKHRRMRPRTPASISGGFP